MTRVSRVLVEGINIAFSSAMKPVVPSVLFVAALAQALVACSATVSGGSSDAASETRDGAPSELVDAAAPSEDASKAVDADAGSKTTYGPATTVSPACNVTERFSAYGEGGFEDGFYAITVTPPSYPFLAESISYTLKSGMVINPDNGATVNCMASTPHKLGFFKAPLGKPPTNPSDVQIWKSSGMGDDRTEKLPTAVLLETGEVAVLLIQMVRAVSATCVRSCAANPTLGENYRATTTNAPFDWSAYTPKGNLLLSLGGRPMLTP